jgi:hypothetical protein
MKNTLILIIIVILLKTDVFAQSFLIEKKIWSTYELGCDENQPKTLYYKFEGDTLIESHHYLKTMMSNNLTDPFRMVNAFYREENNIIYNLFDVDHKELILYNFNLKKGDLYYRPWDQEFLSDPFVVDSVVIRNVLGESRMHWYFSYADWDKNNRPVAEVWIEGIGSLTGPFKPIGQGLTGGIEKLICVHEGDKQIYQNPGFTGCDATTVSYHLLENKQKLINLYSIGKGKVQIQLKNDSKGEIYLYGINGNKVLSMKIINTITQIVVSENGLILYRFISEKGKEQTGKILVK